TRSQASRVAIAVAAALIAPMARASSAPDAPRIALAPGSRLALSGKSTLHDYSSTATRIQLAVELADAVPPGATPLARLAGPGAVKPLVLTIPVEGLKSDKDGLDKNMRKALKAASNPEIVFRLESATGVADGGFRVRGELEVAGRRQPIEVDLRASETPE